MGLPGDVYPSSTELRDEVDDAQRVGGDEAHRGPDLTTEPGAVRVERGMGIHVYLGRTIGEHGDGLLEVAHDRRSGGESGRGDDPCSPDLPAIRAGFLWSTEVEPVHTIDGEVELLDVGRTHHDVDDSDVVGLERGACLPQGPHGPASVWCDRADTGAGVEDALEVRGRAVAVDQLIIELEADALEQLTGDDLLERGSIGQVNILDIRDQVRDRLQVGALTGQRECALRLRPTLGDRSGQVVEGRLSKPGRSGVLITRRVTASWT